MNFGAPIFKVGAGGEYLAKKSARRRIGLAPLLLLRGAPNLRTPTHASREAAGVSGEDEVPR